MIVSLRGVPGLSVMELTYMLTDMGVGFMVAQRGKPVKVGEINQKKVIPVVFGSAKDAVTLMPKIRFRASVFVCDGFFRLRKELKWPCVGVIETSKRIAYTQFSVVDLKILLSEDEKLREPVKYNATWTPYDPTETVLSKLGDSVLSKASTMMYKIKNKDLRAKTYTLVKNWFLGNLSSKSRLLGSINNMHHANRDYADKLIDALTDKSGMDLREVVMRSRANPKEIDALCAKYGVQTFDVRYLLSQLEKDKS